MSLSNYLANIKSSGIYRFVWDKSEAPAAQAQILRLVVGYSEKGPFNTPVYITSEKEFKNTFGARSKKLERYGVWFHRLAIQALSKGPILALNLKTFETETVGAVSFDPQESINITTNLRLAVEDIYNTDRFWTLEPEKLEEPAKCADKYITITSTDSKETSNTIFMRGYVPTGYDVTIKEWYSSVLNGEEIPDWAIGHENDKLSQYFAEIYVFQGQFTSSIASSDVLAKYFNVNGTTVTLKPYLTNAFGEQVDTLAALASNDSSNFVKSYSGILLPEFLSSNNSVISLDLMFNNDNYLHKMMMNFNQTLLYENDDYLSKLDTTGWTSGTKPMMSLSALDPQVSTATYANGTWTYGTTDRAANFYDYTLALTEDTVDPLTYMVDKSISSTGVTVGDKFLTTGSKIATLTKMEQDITIKDVVVDGGTIPTDLTDDPIVKTDFHTTFTTTEVGLVSVKVTAPAGASFKLFSYSATQPQAFQYQFDADGNATNLSGFSTLPVGTHDFVVYADTIGTYKVDVVCGTDTTISNSIEVVYNNFMDLTFDITLGGDQTNLKKCVSSVSATCANMFPTYVEGYTFLNKKPASSSQWDKLQWQHKILKSLSEYQGIRTALTNRTDVEYRYLVDTFEGFVESECKSMLTQICKEKDNAMAIVNFPPISNFSKCTYTSFKDNNGKFQVKYIAQGGNHQKTMATSFSLASQDNGASWASYNTCLNFKDGTTGIKETVPPAALVSNDFMDKYTKYLPYDIVAGSNKGRITATDLVGPDFNFGRADLDVLEPMGVNCMVSVPRKGTFINSNQTAKQNPVTTLSKINVRELCIFLQDEIESLLEAYHWDFNTDNLRSTIKDRADVILETAKNNGGVYKYLNVCDTSNNTDDVINNEMFVLSTSIEPGMGTGKMVQELTLYRKGGMSSIITES